MTQSGTGITSATLIKAKVPVVSGVYCARTFPSMSKQKLCAGHSVEGGVDTCVGEGGGQLLCNKHGYYTLDGIISYGKSCALAGFLTVYSKVCKVLPWIQSHINSPSVTKPTPIAIPKTTPRSTTTTLVPMKNIDGCGVGTYNQDKGPFTKEAEFPWHILLYIFARLKRTYSFCGGVVVKNEWILTAGHCCQQVFEPSDITINFSSDGSTTFATSFSAPAIDMIIHPEFNFARGYNDFCLLKPKSNIYKLMLKSVYYYRLFFSTKCLEAGVCSHQTCVYTRKMYRFMYR